MRWAGIAISAALAALACGGGEPPPEPEASAAAPAMGNQPPLLGSVRLLPQQPRPGDRLALAVRARDPEGEPVQMAAEWLRNGRTVQQGPQLDLSTEGFVRGDRVHAIVTVSDGELDASVTTSTVTFANQRPTIARLELHPRAPSSSSTFTALADAGDPDGDQITLHYRWDVNGRTLPDESDASLEPGRFTRGDEVRVWVAASDFEGEGDWVRSAPRRVTNAMPEIQSDPATAGVNAGRYRYALKAVDPDGDKPLRYRLVEGPAGMAVDLLSGEVSWLVPDGLGGKFPVEVAVRDPHGGEARQSYTVELHWENVPASP